MDAGQSNDRTTAVYGNTLNNTVYGNTLNNQFDGKTKICYNLSVNKAFLCGRGNVCQDILNGIIFRRKKARRMPPEERSSQRSIKKASGEAGNVEDEEFTYEGYAPGGVAIIVDIVTDNRNRTASEVRHIFDKNGGNLGTTGSVSYMFDNKGIIVIERQPGMDEDEMMMTALDAGAEDVKTTDEAFEVYTAPGDFSAVRENLEKAGYAFLSADKQMIPQTTVSLPDQETIEKVQKLLDMLDENDDVSEVYHNAELPEEEEEE